MSKKLSEIGDKYFLDPVPVSSKLNSNLHYVRLYAATETGESPTSDTDIAVTVLTRGELRELVSYVWDSAYDSAVSEEGLGSGVVVRFEEFLKEEGI